jgi:uncharacterized membrane protein YfcA
VPIAVDSDSSTTDVSVLKVAAVGSLAGLLSGLLGVGGGIVLVPGLVSIAKLDRRLAHGTSLAATLPIALASFVAYLAHGHVDWTVAAWLALGAITGAVLGTKLLSVLPRRTITIVFIVVVVATAVRLVFSTTGDGRADLSAAGAVVVVVLGFVTGVIAGLLGVGGGIVMVPAMVVGFGMVPVVAKGTSVTVIIPTAIMGTWRNRTRDNVDLRLAATAGVIGATTAVVGAIIADRMSAQLSNILFGALLVVVAVTQFASLRRMDG